MNQPSPSIRRNLRASLIDGAAYGGMVGAGEIYLAPFALAVGVGEVSAGFVASLPMVAGGILQLISPRAVRRIGSEKSWILACATVQAAAFIPLVFAAIVGEISLPMLFCVGAIYWASGLATGPAWNVWIETMVPVGVRARYFASRSRVAQLTTLAGFLLGGAWLAAGARMGFEITAYAGLFFAAAALRLISVFWLAQHRPLPPRTAPPMPLREASDQPKQSTIGDGRRLLLFLVLFQGMVQLSGPFFTPYMLSEIGFSYGQFVTLIAVNFLAKVVSLSTWGRISRRYSARALLWIGAIGVVPMSALWIVSQNFVWLVLVQAFSGVMWAAYELGFFLMFFESLPKGSRTRMLTYYNFANTLAIFVGASIGGWILHWYQSSATGYMALFGLSSVGRMCALGVLASVSLSALPIVQIGIRVLGLRPGSGSVDSPVLSSLDDD